MTQQIVPRYKLMLFYDLSTEDPRAYYQFLMTEMIPSLQALGVYIFRAFHIIPATPESGHRLRQIEFVAEDLETLQMVLGSRRWKGYEARLSEHVTHYRKKIVPFRPGFQL